MSGYVWGLPRWDWVEFAGLLLVAAWAVWYYRSHDPPEEMAMAEHRWVPYAGILTREPALGAARRAGLGAHTRTCTVCGVITDDEDDCADLECAPGRHR